MDTHNRLRIAARIHFALLRQYGENVSVSTLLEDSDAAQEALWVCDASGIAELETLAKQFRAAPKLMPEIPTLGTTPQEMVWAADTSGFGITQLPEPLEPDHVPEWMQPRPPAWFSPARWLRGKR